MAKIVNHTDLNVYREAFDSAMEIYRHSKSFPADERYSLTNQIRRASRSVCANIAEGWRRRRYQAAFLNKLSEAESEVAETQVWLQFAVQCEYMTSSIGRTLYSRYGRIIRTLVGMINHPESWILPGKRPKD